MTRLPISRPRSAGQPKPDWRRHFDRLSTRESADGIARRRFLQGLLATGGLAMTGGAWMFQAGEVKALGPDDRILVVVLFGGGNDGFSMVVPANAPQYQSARGPLALPASSLIPIENDLYWHYNLPGIASLYDSGDVAIVQGIGDPADDRSHFSSTARWMRGANDSASIGFTGWLGRYLDGAGLGGLGGISVGHGGIPLHMRGNLQGVTSLPTYGNLYGAAPETWEVPAFDAFREIRNVGPGGVWTDAVATSVADSIDTAGTVAPIYDPDTLPPDGISRDLAIAAEAINLDIGARVLTTEYGDFDTHDDHAPRHQALMAEFDAGVTEFFNRLNPAFRDRVTLMTFSEFGRSWTANDSPGVDHGTASMALVIGNPVAGGLYGQLPNLDTFDAQGDLEATVDFRSYYATILDGWLNANSNQILGGNYENLGIFDTGLASCDGLAATIVGTSGNDVLTGTAGVDVIWGGDGNDTIDGLDGNDLICAGEGADVIYGGAGDDRIFGDAGADFIRSEAGDDTVYGGSGNDRIRGGDGNDLLDGEGGADKIWGEVGNDTIDGHGGADTIEGGGGFDTIRGQGARDTITGGGGDDTIEGGAAQDTLVGSGGNDFIKGGIGRDTIDGDAGNDNLLGGSGADTISGGPGDDILNGQAGADTCIGGSGNDQEISC